MQRGERDQFPDVLIALLEPHTALLRQMNRKLDRLMTAASAAQEALDALTTQLGAIDVALNTAVTALEAEIANLQAAGVNTDGISAAVTQLSNDVAAAATAAGTAGP